MNDCQNAEIRDQLPDLVHERLDLSARALVLAHVDGCVDCSAELELLRNVRGMLVAGTPRVDVAYVVQALPKPPARAIRLESRRRTWADWRIAAAVTLLAVGGSSVAVMHRAGEGPAVQMTDTAISRVAPTTTSAAASPATANAPDSSSPKASAASPAAATSHTATEGASTSPRTADASPVVEKASLGGSSRLGDLNERQLQTLLRDIQGMQAVPVAEPDPVTLPIGAVTSSSEDGA